MATRSSLTATVKIGRYEPPPAALMIPASWTRLSSAAQADLARRAGMGGRDTHRREAGLRQLPPPERRGAPETSRNGDCGLDRGPGLMTRQLHRDHADDVCRAGRKSRSCNSLRLGSGAPHSRRDVRMHSADRCPRAPRFSTRAPTLAHVRAAVPSVRASSSPPSGSVNLHQLRRHAGPTAAQVIELEGQRIGAKNEQAWIGGLVGVTAGAQISCNRRRTRWVTSPGRMGSQ
jgi:hypothetical protein